MPVSLSAHEKLRFWRKWTLLSLGIITLSYIVSLFAVLFVHGAFGFHINEWGTPLSQTLMQMAGGAVIGLGTGIYQRSMLRKVFDARSSWIYALITGFVLTELITGIILWKAGLNRGELRFFEGNPLPEAVIFAAAGALTGLLQWALLRRSFSRSAWWIVASALAWGICILMTYITGLVSSGASPFGFIIGALFYGALTGAILTWVLRAKEPRE